MNARQQQKLITDNIGFVISMAKQFQGKGLDLDDLVNEGNLGLLRAADKYDASRGVPFVAYAAPYVRQALQQAVAEHGRIVSVPASNVSEVNRINKLRALFEQINGRKPNINEIAESANIPERRVMETLKASARQVSVNAPVSENSKTTLLDVLAGDDFGNTDDKVQIDTLRSELACAIESLNERERLVVGAFYGIGQEELTLAEIGQRYGMKRERARQIRNKGVRHLRKISNIFKHI